MKLCGCTDNYTMKVNTSVEHGRLPDFGEAPFQAPSASSLLGVLHLRADAAVERFQTCESQRKMKTTFATTHARPPRPASIMLTIAPNNNPVMSQRRKASGAFFMNFGTTTAAIFRPLTPARFQEPSGSSLVCGTKTTPFCCGASTLGFAGCS